MAGRPTQVPRWAWGAVGGAIIQPPSGSAEAGFPAGMKPPAMWMNFQFNALGAWVDFLRGPNVETWTRTAWGTSPATYDASSAVFLAIDTTTTDATGLAYRYLIVGVETSGPTTTLRASRSGADWVRRTNIESAPGTPLALAYMQSSTRWLLADNTPAVYYCARDAGGATGPVGSGSGNWTVATLDADDGSGGGISNPVAFAHDPVAGTAVLLTVSGALYSSDGATWTEYTGTSGTARSGNGMDLVWDGANYVFITGSGQIYASPTADGTFAYKATLAGGAQTYRLAVGELGEVLAYVVGDGDTEDIYRSTNSGASWTTIEPTTGFSRISRVRYHGGTWLAASTVAPFLWVSSDATTWTRVRMPVSGSDLALKDLAWDGNGWMVVGNGWVLQCPRGADPTDATYIPDTTPATLADAAYLRGRRISTTAPTDGQVLRWDNAAQEWEPATISSGSMPTASGADEIPLSTGAGTTYTARTLASVRALLRAAAETYTLGGSTHDYTADAAYAPSGLTVASGSSVSGRLGDGTLVPFFSAAFKGGIAALARNASGVRLTHTTANSASNPWPYADAAPHLTIPLSRDLVDCQIDLTYAANLDAIGLAASGSDIIETFVGLTRHASGQRPYTIGGVWLVTLAAVNGGAPSELAYGIAAQGAFTTTETARDVSSSGEGTSAGVTARDVRVIVKGPTIEVLTGPSGGSLTRRIYYADISNLPPRDGLALVVSIAQNQATPLAGYWIELRELVVTPL